MTLYSAGFNTPGYMPEADVATFTDIVDAIAYLVEEIRFDAAAAYEESSDHDLGPAEVERLETVGSTLEALAEQLDRYEDTSEWCVRGLTFIGLNNVAYWIATSEEED